MLGEILSYCDMTDKLSLLTDFKAACSGRPKLSVYADDFDGKPSAGDRAWDREDLRHIFSGAGGLTGGRKGLLQPPVAGSSDSLIFHVIMSIFQGLRHGAEAFRAIFLLVPDGVATYKSGSAPDSQSIGNCF
jgi:hypothetical protein